MKKDFNSKISGGLSSLIPTGESRVIKEARAKAAASGRTGKSGRPKRTDKDNEAAPSAEKGTKPGEGRKTYIVNIVAAEKLEAIGYWERKTTKEVIGEAIAAYVAAYEKKHGSIKKPKK